MGRSLRASIAGIESAKQAFKLKNWTQDYLAGSVRCSRQVISKFFARKPVEKRLFEGICVELNLDWNEIAEPENVQTRKSPHFSSIEELVYEVREIIRDRVKNRYGTMRVLNMPFPIELGNIYTNVRILDKITSRNRLEFEKLPQLTSEDDINCLGLSRASSQCMEGLEAVNTYDKLMILGKPGAGKTTFLKHILIQCIDGDFQTERVPVFVSLKDFAEASGRPSLPSYIEQLLLSYGLASNLTTQSTFIQSLTPWNHTSTEQLLKEGKLLILLDGLDEVREIDTARIIKQVRELTNHFYHNHILMTCRIAASEYTFELFTEVEIADFNNKQITDFANKWFHSKADFFKAEKFSQKIEEESRIRELATNPLLLTLLCLVFEEVGNFPSNRSELYAEGIDVLLKKWDTKRNIERGQIYKGLSLQRKEDLLGKIALEAFVVGHYFFKQEDLEKTISSYIKNLPIARTAPDALQLDSEAVLNAIEAQHGLLVARARRIYSFSHLTFQEYFTARQIKEKRLIRSLTDRFDQPRWREVFLLTVEMLPSADDLLKSMQKKAYKCLSDDVYLSQFLNWVSQKTNSTSCSYKAAAIRSFYFTLALEAPEALKASIAADHVLKLNLDLAFAIDESFTLEEDVQNDIAFDLTLYRVLYCTFYRTLNRARSLCRNPQLQQELNRLNERLNEPIEIPIGYNWEADLREVMIRYRDIGHSWQFDSKQTEKLRRYYNANYMIVSCLNSDCYVDLSLREKLEQSIMSPSLSYDADSIEDERAG